MARLVYGAVAGLAELREAISDKFRRDNALDYRHDETIGSTGGKQVLVNAFFATLNPSDEVLIPAPRWVSYPDMVRACGGVPRILETHEQDVYKLTPELLEETITAQTKWLVLNSPSNPAGSVYRTEELEEFGSVLRRHPHVWILTDDIYEHITFGDQPFTTIAQAVPDLIDRTLTMNGVSKAYAMPGWRIGYAGGPRPLIDAMTLAQGQMTSAASSLAQWAALEALTGPQDLLDERRGSYLRRRDLMLRALGDAPGLRASVPDGAFYLFVACDDLLGRNSAEGTVMRSDVDVAVALLREARVAVVAGTAFAAPGHVRLSFASSDADLLDTGGRIREFCRSVR